METTTQPLPFGTELRRRRRHARLSLAQLAARVKYSKGHLSRVESGSKTPSLELARQCDDALGASGKLAALVQVRAGRVAAPMDVSCQGESWVVRMSPDGYGEFQAIDRRSHTADGAAGLVSWLMPPADPTDPALVLPAYQAMFDQLRRLGQATDPASVTPILVAATNALRGVAARSPAANRAPVLRMSARFAEYTGWMAQEASDEAAALWWTSRAVEMANAAGDRDLVAYGLVRRAEIALFRNDFVSTIALAQQAQARQCHRRVRGLAALREAQGHAMAGEVSACRRTLERAESLMRAAGTGHTDGGPALGSSNWSDPIAFATGWCRLDLGDLTGAVTVLGPELAQLPDYAHRARARHAARLALALARLREVDQSCGVIEPVLTHAHIIDSATIRTDLARLHHTLNRWPSHQAVRRLTPRLAATLRTNLTVGGRPQTGTPA